MPEERVTVRVCSPSDAAALGPAFAARWEGQQEGRWDLLTAWANEKLVGVGQLGWTGPFNPTVAAARPDQVELGFLQVEPSWRGQGIGTALCELAVHRCRERGVKTLGLTVGVDNARATALYRRLGFADSGLRFTDTYTAADGQGNPYQAVEAGMYLLLDVPAS